jgi:hypothetical protein
MSRINIVTINALLSFGRRTLLNGIITGKPFGETISHIVQTAATFGADETERADHFPASTSIVDYDEMKAAAVEQAIEGMFSKNVSMEQIVGDACQLGAAWGYEAEKLRVKHMPFTDLLTPIQRKLAANQEVSQEEIDAYLDLVMQAEIETACKFIHELMKGSGKELSGKIATSPHFMAFQKKYMDVLVG